MDEDKHSQVKFFVFNFHNKNSNFGFKLHTYKKIKYSKGYLQLTE